MSKEQKVKKIKRLKKFKIYYKSQKGKFFFREKTEAKF